MSIEQGSQVGGAGRSTGLFRYGLQTARGHWRAVGVAALIMALVGLLDSAALALFVPMVDFLTGNWTPASSDNQVLEWLRSAFDVVGITYTLRWIVVVIVVIMITRGLSLFGQHLYLSWLRARYEVALKQEAYQQVTSASWPFFLRQRTGDLTNTLTVEARRAGIAFQNFTAAVGALLNIAIYMTVAFVISWPMTLVSVSVALLVMLVLRVFVDWARRLGAAATEVNSDLAAEVIEAMGGAKVIKSGAMEPFSRLRYGRFVSRLGRIDVRLGMAKGALESGYELVFVAVLAGGLLVAMRYLDIDTSTLVLFALLMFRTYQRSHQFQRSMQAVGQYLPALDRVRRLTGDATANAEQTGGKRFTKLSQGIELKEVSYAYAAGDAVVEHVSFTVPAGSMTALVGPSGAGKTTVMDMVIGLLQPTSGEVLVDGTRLGAYDLASWRARLGYVAQGTMLFNDTIAKNIAWGEPDAAEDDVVEAARLAHAHEFIEAMPDGYQTAIGDRGVRLSGGQRQRLALARALFRKPELLVLDEATSELDAESEAVVQQAIESLRGQVTIIVVAHRVGSVMAADAVHVVAERGIIESGVPAELLKKRGAFYRLHRQGVGGAVDEAATPTTGTG